ncbi:MAG TPA: hypothetical protein VKS22_08235 [Candidatus Binataceae bacterium]|nr:hypothetical protein [Candidatus Binataceae bacterium]
MDLDLRAKKPNLLFQRLAAELTDTSPLAAQPKHEGHAKAFAEIRELATLNYAKPLRQKLSRGELQEILREAKRGAWPNLNKQAVKLVSPNEFVQLWSPLGLEIKFANFSAKEDLSLLGFYTNGEAVRRRPLICVNIAHHPAVVGAALVHEMGHHLTARMFASNAVATRSLSLTGYKEHLTDQAELVADILVSFGMYPEGIARMLLDNDAAQASPKHLSDPVFAKVLAYVADQYGLRLDAKFAAGQKLYALAGLIHYTKLREALLGEFDT